MGSRIRHWLFGGIAGNLGRNPWTLGTDVYPRFPRRDSARFGPKVN
jgi:hypothetical protein